MRMTYWTRITMPFVSDWREVTKDEFQAEWAWAEFIDTIDPDYPVPIQFAVWEQ